MPSPRQAKASTSVNPAASHFLQERQEVQPGEEVWWGGGRTGKEKREKEELRGFFSKRTHHLLKGGHYLVQLFCP